MPQQFMDYQQEDEVSHALLSAGKIAPMLSKPSSYKNYTKTVVIGYFYLLCLVIFAYILRGTAPWIGLLFLSLLFILVVSALAILFKYDWSRREK